jgi:hypothetical protein
MVLKTSGHNHTTVVGVGSSASVVAAGVGSPVGHDDAFPCDDSSLVGVMFCEGLYRYDRANTIVLGGKSCVQGWW